MSSAGNQLLSELVVRIYSAADQQAVIDLWGRCDLLRPWNNPVKDIARKLRANSDWFLVAVIRNKVVGSIMIGYEGHRGWITIWRSIQVCAGNGLDAD